MKPMLINLVVVLVLCGGVCGCSTMVPPDTNHGIVNLGEVEPGVWRGGQPSAEGWAWLKSQGVTNVIKLNLESEGSDEPAEAMGLCVKRFPIDAVDMVLGSPKQTAPAASVIKPGTFVHCLHGQDRAGLVVAVYRVGQGWSKAEAEKEMLQHGFHKELMGLWSYWQRVSVCAR